MLPLVNICKPDTPESTILKIYKCSTYSSIFSFFESNGVTPVNLSGVSGVTFHMLSKNSNLDYLRITLNPTILGSRITILNNPLSGKVALTLTDEETCFIPFYCGKWWISLTYPDGTVVRKAAGLLDIREPFSD